MAERESVSDDPITMRLVPCVKIRSAPRLMPTHIDLVGTVKNQCAGKSNSGNFDQSVLWITDYPVSVALFPCAIDGSRQSIRSGLPRRRGLIEKEPTSMSPDSGYTHTHSRSTVPAVPR
jgi:hypothetical protein